MIYFRKPLEGIERPQMEADVTIVGGGPAGMACALRVSQLIDAHNHRHPDAPLSKENIYVLEKAREIGQHCLSGAVLDPRSLDELLPGWQDEAPIEAQVEHESFYYLTKTKSSELLFEGDRVTGIRTDDKGIDKQNQKKSNFEPGYDLKSKVTVLAEGARGSLTKQLIGRFNLDKDRNPQTYGVGVKELWELPPGRIRKGEVILTLGWPLTSKEFGGSWMYGANNNLVSLGYVTSLEYSDPRTDPQRVLQEFKKHPLIAELLQGGKLVRYGAKTVPYGGWYALPQLAGNGWMIAGDSAGFLNAQRLKGIHLAIKSGMLAAETAFEALLAANFSADKLQDFQLKVNASWIKDELWRVRNFHQGFANGLLSGIIHTGLQELTGGRGLYEVYPAHAGHERMKHLDELPADGGDHAQMLGKAKGDGKLTFDKLTDLYHSGTKHEEDQPSHLIIHDTNICNSRCVTEFGNPCQNFCPANVYEMVETTETTSGKTIHLNPSNCVHCKTCDIMDPYQIITWVPPEGGGGPNYDGM